MLDFREDTTKFPLFSQGFLPLITISVIREVGAQGWQMNLLQGWTLYIVFPGSASGKESGCQCRICKRLMFKPWVGKIPGVRNGNPLQLFLPGKFHEQRNLAGYSPWGCKESDTTEWISTHTETLYIHIHNINILSKFSYLKHSCSTNQQNIKNICTFHVSNCLLTLKLTQTSINGPCVPAMCFWKYNHYIVSIWQLQKNCASAHTYPNPEGSKWKHPLSNETVKSKKFHSDSTKMYSHFHAAAYLVHKSTGSLSVTSGPTPSLYVHWATYLIRLCLCSYL